MLKFLCLCLLAALPLGAADPVPAAPSAVPASAAAPVTAPAAARPVKDQVSIRPDVPVFSDAEWNHSQAQAPNQASSTSVTGRAAVGLVFSVGAIVALAVVLGLVVKRLGLKRVLPGKGRHLQVIETVPIGFKRAVSLLRLGDQVLVVGQGEHELQHLATLPASVLGDEAKTPSAPAPATAEPMPQPGQLSAFRATLEQLIGKRP